MHSRNNCLDNISVMNSSQVQAEAQQRESKCDEPSNYFQSSSQPCQREPPDNMNTEQQKHKISCCSQAHNKNSDLTEQTTSLRNGGDLSHDDLLLLLSILEGELQARDEVITVLRAEKIDLALLEANYGFVTPPNVLRALQRDTIQSKSHGWQEDIYEKPITELEKLVEKQKQTYKRMLEQLLLVEQTHRQTLYRLEDEKHNHSEYMKKSDEFTNLLEQERERLKLLNDQEKTYQEQKEEENNRKVTNLKDELTKLKSFALLVIDEQQQLTEQLAQQTSKVQELQAAATDAQEELDSVQSRAQKMESKVLHLEAELRDQAVQFHQKQEAMNTKLLTDENSQNGHLHQKLSTFCQELDKLQKSKKALCKAEEEMQELRDKNSNGEKGNSSFVSEVEELRMVEIEGNDEELIKMEYLCRDLKRRLERESTQHCSLKAEVDNLIHRIMALEKLEDAFGKSKKEFSSLKYNIGKEKTVTKHMCNELDNLRGRIKEIEAAECILEKTEWTLKEELTKLKTLTVMLVDERKTMAEKLKQLENKVQNSTDKLQAEQEKVTLVTEKLIEESKKALKIKVEMEEKICVFTKERDYIESKLKAEEEKNNALQYKVSIMKKRLQALETVEREFLRNKAKQDNMKEPIHSGFQQKDNKVNDLTQEVECLRRKLGEINMVEDDIPKTHNEDESLEKRYSNETALMEELAIARKELSKYQLVEKENFNQEHILCKQLKEEEFKSSHLTREVEALKEKIHNYMGTEESICNMKTEYAALQRKLTQQEVKNKELVREKDSLTRELERYRHFSKSLRPGIIGRRFSDLRVSTKEVQTEPTDSPTPTYKNLSLLEQPVVNGKMYEESALQYEPNHDEINPEKCSPSITTGVSGRAQETDVKAGHTLFCAMPQRHVCRYNSSSPSVITNEDNTSFSLQQIFHLDIPNLHTFKSNTESPSPCYSTGQKQRTSELSSVNPAKVNSKIASGIRINPVSTPIPQPSQITAPVETFQQSGPTRIPKPKAYSTPRGTNSRAALTQGTGTAQALLKLGKNIHHDLNTEDLCTKS